MNDTKNKIAISVKFLGIFFVLAFLIFLIIFAKKNIQQKNVNNNTITQSDNVGKKEEKPEGKILLSLSSLGEKEKSNLYFYDFSQNELKKQEGEFFQTASSFTGKFSSDGSKLVFAATKDGTDVSQIFLVNKDGSQLRQLTFDANYSKRNPVWSPDEKNVVYQSIKKDEKNHFNVENWEIHIVNLEGKDSLVTHGANPDFIPNGKILVLRETGIFAYDQKGQNEEILVKNNEKTKNASNKKMEVSPNGKYIAVASKSSFLVLFKTISLEPLQIGEAKSIAVKGYWPVFSPDEKYLALEEVDGNNENPKLVVFDLGTLEKKEVYDLGKYDQMKMFVTDWTD